MAKYKFNQRNFVFSFWWLDIVLVVMPHDNSPAGRPRFFLRLTSSSRDKFDASTAFRSSFTVRFDRVCMDLVGRFSSLCIVGRLCSDNVQSWAHFMLSDMMLSQLFDICEIFAQQSHSNRRKCCRVCSTISSRSAHLADGQRGQSYMIGLSRIMMLSKVIGD